MARPRRRGGFGQAFTFGNRVPATVGGVLVVMLLASMLSWSNPELGSLLVLHPIALAGLQLWRLVTWALPVPLNPFSLLFTALMVYWLGQQLSFEWSERTFLSRLLGLTVGSGLATAVVGLAWAPAAVPHVGAGPILWALIFMWGLMHPGAEMRWFGILPMTGKLVAQLVVGGTVLFAVFGQGGIGAFVPNFAALGIAWVQLTSRGGARRWWLRTKQRWNAWRLERRTRHLKVVKKRDGEEERPRWMN